MSATAAVTAKKYPPKKTTLEVKRKPGNEASHRLRECAKQLLRDGFDYRESQELFRLFLLQTAVSETGVKVKAAARLGISRDHVRDYLERGKELI